MPPTVNYFLDIVERFTYPRCMVVGATIYLEEITGSQDGSK